MAAILAKSPKAAAKVMGKKTPLKSKARGLKHRKVKEPSYKEYCAYCGLTHKMT